MKTSISALLIASFAVTGSIFAISNYDKYKMMHAYKKQQTINLYAHAPRTKAEQEKLNTLSHEWASRELTAYTLNRLNASESLGDYKRRLTEHKIRAIELAGKTNRSAAEQAELEKLGHAWALREQAVYKFINAMHKSGQKRVASKKPSSSLIKKTSATKNIKKTSVIKNMKKSA